MTNDCKTCPVSTGTHKPAEALHQIDEPLAEALLELAAYRFTVENREARIAELESQLDAIGAGGVEPLRKPAAAPPAVQAAVPEAIEQMAVDRYKVVPSHESMFHRWAVVAGNGTQQLYIGREGECQNMARKFMGAFLDGAFVAMQNAAPAHPAEGVPAQIETLRSELAEEKEAADNWRRLALQFDNHRLQALWHLKRILHEDSSVDEYKAAEQFLAAPPLDGQAVLAQRIAALAATQPAAQGAATTGYIAPKGRYVPPVLFSPYTGEPRDARDIASDPRGILIVPPGAALAAQAKQGGAA